MSKIKQEITLIEIQTSPSGDRLHHLIESARNRDPDAVVKAIHNHAAQEYVRAKKAKIEELKERSSTVSPPPDQRSRMILRKKMDNHASAVATRIRREAALLQFEIAIRNTMAENAQLADACNNLNEIIAQKDEEIRSLTAARLNLKKE